MDVVTMERRACIASLWLSLQAITATPWSGHFRSGTSNLTRLNSQVGFEKPWTAVSKANNCSA